MTATEPRLPVVDLDALGPQVGTRFRDVRLPEGLVRFDGEQWRALSA